MQLIPLQALPSQTFSVPLDGNQWDFVIKTTNGTISVSLALNGVPVVSNARAVAGMRIIADEYQEAGNFVFITQSFQIPDYTQFGISQQLIYMSAADLAEARELPPEPLTPADFDPNAALPLRLFPQGYVLDGPPYITEAGEFYVTESGSSKYRAE